MHWSYPRPIWKRSLGSIGRSSFPSNLSMPPSLVPVTIELVNARTSGNAPDAHRSLHPWRRAIWLPIDLRRPKAARIWRSREDGVQELGGDPNVTGTAVRLADVRARSRRIWRRLFHPRCRRRSSAGGSSRCSRRVREHSRRGGGARRRRDRPDDSIVRRRRRICSRRRLPVEWAVTASFGSSNLRGRLRVRGGDREGQTN